MQIKKSIHDICSRNHITKKIYHILSWIKGWFRCLISLGYPIYQYKQKKAKAVFLIFTPQHANLGDHAIAYAEQKILGKLNIPFFEITGEQLRVLDYYKMLSVLNDSFILVNGGGNLGTLWPDIEKLNRRIITSNPNATIFILPNTIFYDSNTEGKQEFEKSRQIYNAHKNLYLYAREPISYDVMRNAYYHVKLIPDLVLSLNYSDKKKIRSGCLLCLRQDCESTMSFEDFEWIKKITKKIFGDCVINADTVLDYNVSVSDRETELEKKFEQFCSAELVITDRLHGMIFATICGTKCIVLNSKSPKMKGCYHWVENLDYIRFIDEIKDIEKVYNQMPNSENCYDNIAISEKIKELENDILNIYLGENLKCRQ